MGGIERVQGWDFLNLDRDSLFWSLALVRALAKGDVGSYGVGFVYG